MDHLDHPDHPGSPDHLDRIDNLDHLDQLVSHDHKDHLDHPDYPGKPDHLDHIDQDRLDHLDHLDQPDQPAEWLRFFASTRVLFFKSTNFWSADYMAIILLKTATTYDKPTLLSWKSESITLTDRQSNNCVKTFGLERQNREGMEGKKLVEENI